MSSSSNVSPSKPHRKPQQHGPNQHQQSQHIRVNECDEGEWKDRPDLDSIVTSASHSQLSQILLDLCRHSKTASDFTRSHLFQTAVTVPVSKAAARVTVTAPVAVASPASRTTNEATKKSKVLRSILKKRKDDTLFCSSSGEVSWSPSCPDEASPSLGRVSLQLPSSVAFSLETTASSSTSISSDSNSNSKSKSNSNSNSKSKSNSSTSSNRDDGSKSKASLTPELDAHPSKKRKGPTSTPTTRCRNCGSEYTNTTPHSSPSRNESSSPSSSTTTTTRRKEKEAAGEKEELCIHHPGEREVQPSHSVWEDFDPDLHGDAWTLMEYEAFACGFRWSCCKREVGERGCVVAGRHEAAPVPLGMPLWKRVRR